ncbi:MAG: DUF6020 family protein, partial [Acidimicrobiia bacterium]
RLPGVPDHRRPFWLGLLSLFPLLVWWLGWFPGFLSPDSVDQLQQAERFSFGNFHPAIHTISLWALTRLWDTPGVVTLVQVGALALVLAVVAARLVRLGVPAWLAVGSAWLVALLPAVGATTVAVWKDVPYSIAVLWVFAELLLLVGVGPGYWDRRANPLRLGVAAALVWLLRHNGLLTVLPLLVMLAVVYRRRWRGFLVAPVTLVALVLAVQVGLYELLPVDRSTPAAAELLIGDVAAVLTHDPATLAADERAYLQSIAPRRVWVGRYDCYQAESLLFAPDLDKEAIRRHPDRFLAVAVPVLLRSPETVLAHRLCAASYLWVPAQPDGVFFHRPPYAIAPNDLEIEREPLSWRAFFLTEDIFVWAEQPGRLWLTWRPALPLWLAAVIYAGLAARRLWPLLWPGGLLFFQLLNVVVTTTGQEFRYAFPIYLMSWLSLPLASLVFRPAAAELEADIPAEPAGIGR